MVGTDMSTWLHDEEGRRRLAMVSLPSTRMKGERKVLERPKHALVLLPARRFRPSSSTRRASASCGPTQASASRY